MSGPKDEPRWQVQALRFLVGAVILLLVSWLLFTWLGGPAGCPYDPYDPVDCR